MTNPAALAAEAGQLLVAGFDGTEPSAEILDLIRAGLGGVILYRKNCEDARQVLALTNRLQEAARRAGHGQPLLVAIDQEQGRVVRVSEGVTLFPAMGALARGGDPGLVGRVAEAVGRELLAIGVNWLLAPVADVPATPESFLGERCFGRNPERAAAMTSSFVRGASRAGILSCAKHFPGHGSAGGDSHVTAPVSARSRAALEACDLLPFRAAVAAGAPAVMTAHVTFPALDALFPASLSPNVVAGLLRAELGFAGAVVCDDLEMAGAALGRTLRDSARAALRAGSDLLIVSRMLLPVRDLPGLLAALREDARSGELPAAAVAAALGRVRRLKRGLPWSADPGAAAGVLRAPAHLALAEEARRAAGG